MYKLELEWEQTIIDGIRDAAASRGCSGMDFVRRTFTSNFRATQLCSVESSQTQEAPIPAPNSPSGEIWREVPPTRKKQILCKESRAVWLRLALLVAMGNAVQKEMEIALDLDEGDNLYAWAQTTLNFTAPASQRTERRYVPEFGALFRRAVAV